jgi:hypothetical protein
MIQSSAANEFGVANSCYLVDGPPGVERCRRKKL